MVRAFTLSTLLCRLKRVICSLLFLAKDITRCGHIERKDYDTALKLRFSLCLKSYLWMPDCLSNFLQIFANFLQKAERIVL